MEFVVIDFSDIYFERIVKKPKPAQRAGKFMQISNEDTDTEYLVLSPKELSTYHANIIERFCLLHKLEGRYRTTNHKERTFFEIYDPEWTIMGGGVWKIDEENKQLELSGESGAYGKFDFKGLKKKLHETDRLAGFKILINGF